MTTLPPLMIQQPETRDASLETQSFQPARHDQVSDDTRTPTRDSFAAANGKRTLPMSPTEEEPPPDFLKRSNLDREGSHRSTGSQAIQDQDVDMAGSDEEAEGSENDSQDDGTERPSKKKKKGQRFFCTDYPPCNLSFTRSEHLARHIRKHTGERPFQCHCSRRFSRLDNLRQHAQTVHVNEDIPGDSLAATGTRFQRQIRTDRVRPPGSRARASTGGSQTGHRGHGRNQSTSSITSTTSTLSSISTLSRENSGRRPQSMTLGDQRRGGLTLDTLRASPTHNYAYTHQPGSGNSTPTSYYGGTPSSPFGSTLGSPITISRNPNNGPWDNRNVARRLSVPSSTTIFQAGGSAPQIQHQFPAVNPSANSSTLGSPTSSTFSAPRSDVPHDDWRRRTWHPNTLSNYSYPRPATSGLSYSQTPNEPRPAFTPQAVVAAGQTPKLPGIETFDQMSNRPSTPPHPIQPPLNAAITPGRLTAYPSMDRRQPGHGHQRGVHSWDMSLHQNLTRLDITGDTPPRETGGWVQQQVHNPVNSLQSSPQHPAVQPNLVAPSGQPMQVPPQLVLPSQPAQATGPMSQDQPVEQNPSPPRPTSQPHAIAPSGAQRTGWPLTVPHKLMQRPNQSSAVPSTGESIYTPNTYRDYQPQVIHANGYIEPPPIASAPKYALFPSYPPTGQTRSPDFSRRPDTSGLDALVAVATSESRQLPAHR